MKEYFENNEENVQMSDLHHLYYMKKEKCADTTGDIMKKQNDTEDQEQPYLIERFDSYCKKVLQFEVMQYYHVKKIAEKHIVLIDDVPQSISSLFCRYDEYPSLQNWFYVFGQEIEVKNSFLADALTELTGEQQTIILAHYFLEMSDREIGERLKLSVKTVNRRRHSALQRLSQELCGESDIDGISSE